MYFDKDWETHDVYNSYGSVYFPDYWWDRQKLNECNGGVDPNRDYDRHNGVKYQLSILKRVGNNFRKYGSLRSKDHFRLAVNQNMAGWKVGDWADGGNMIMKCIREIREYNDIVVMDDDWSNGFWFGAGVLYKVSQRFAELNNKVFLQMVNQYGCKVPKWGHIEPNFSRHVFTKKLLSECKKQNIPYYEQYF